MWACPVEVRDVFAEYAGELPLAEDEQVIEAFPAHAAQEALAVGLRPRRAVWRAPDADAGVRGDPREGRPEFAVVVADQVPGTPIERGGLAELLGDPGVGRMPRRAHVEDPPRAQFDDEGCVERPEEEVGDQQEVAGPDLVGVVPEEGRPRLPARARGLVTAQVGLEGALGDGHPQLQEFAADALGTPERVVGRQQPDQGDRLRRERRASRPRARLAPPERAETRAMSAQQGLGLDEEQGLPPGADAAREQHQERQIRPRHGHTLDAAAQHQQLLAQQGVLGEQLRPTPHQIGPGPGHMRHCQRPCPEVCFERAAQPGTDPQQPTAASGNETHRRTPR